MTTAPLRANGAFVRWATAATISTLGTGISTVVIPILVYERTGSAAQTGAVFGLRVVPYLIFGLVAGPIADRFDRRRLVVWGIVGEGVAMATIPFVDLFGKVSVAQIFVVTFVASVCFVFHDAATFGALPAITGPTHLPAANGLLTSTESAALVAGPAVGSILSGWIGAAPAVWFDAASFFVAAAMIAGIAVPLRRDDDPPVATSLIAQAGEGLRFIRDHSTILTLILVGFVNSLAFGAVLGQIVVYADRALGVPESDWRVGALYTAGAVGTLIAGLSFGRMFRVDRVRALTPSGLFGAAVVCAGLATTSTFVVAVGLAALFSLCIQVVISTGITYRQLASPDHLVSSVNVVGRMVAWGGQPFGALIGGFVSASIGVQEMVGGAAAVFALAATWAFLGLRRVSDPAAGP